MRVTSDAYYTLDDLKTIFTNLSNEFKTTLNNWVPLAVPATPDNIKQGDTVTGKTLTQQLGTQYWYEHNKN